MMEEKNRSFARFLTQVEVLKMAALLLAILKPSVSTDPSGIQVVLGSTLKQGSLCPGEDTATFTCSAVGTDLVWLVDGRPMAYNANAQVGALRSNALADQIAILMRVETIAGRVANRMSVLIITALPSATEPTAVKCHNGSILHAEEIRFLRREASILSMPQIDHFNAIREAGRIHLNWTVPNLDEAIHTIDHYFIQVDGSLPILVKNSSAILFVEFSDTNHTLHIWAFDRCNNSRELQQLFFGFEESIETTTASPGISYEILETITGDGGKTPVAYTSKCMTMVVAASSEDNVIH